MNQILENFLQRRQKKRGHFEQVFKGASVKYVNFYQLTHVKDLPQTFHEGENSAIFRPKLAKLNSEHKLKKKGIRGDRRRINYLIHKKSSNTLNQNPLNNKQLMKSTSHSQIDQRIMYSRQKCNRTLQILSKTFSNHFIHPQEQKKKTKKNILIVKDEPPRQENMDEEYLFSMEKVKNKAKNCVAKKRVTTRL